MKNLEEVVLKAFKAIFGDDGTAEVDGVLYPVEETSKSKLSYVSVEGYRFIEQNPEKASRWAQRAREGHSIMWVMKGKRYVARVEDGKFYGFGKEK